MQALSCNWKASQSRITPTPRGMSLSAPRSGDGGAAQGSSNHSGTRGTTRKKHNRAGLLPRDIGSCRQLWRLRSKRHKLTVRNLATQLGYGPRARGDAYESGGGEEGPWHRSRCRARPAGCAAQQCSLLLLPWPMHMPIYGWACTACSGRQVWSTTGAVVVTPESREKDPEKTRGLLLFYHYLFFYLFAV